MQVSINRKYITSIAFVSGAASLSLELLITKALHPFYGASAYVWTVVLCASLSGITLGYFLSAYLSGKLKSQNGIFLILFSANVWILLCSFLFPLIISAFENKGIITGVTISSFFLLFMPLLLLGTVSPLLIGLSASKTNTGETAGKIFSISTLGGIITILFFGFYAIEKAGISNCIKLLGLAGLTLTLISVSGLSGKRKSLFALPLLFIFFPPFSEKTEGETKYRSEGMYGEIRVLDLKEEDSKKATDERVLLVNGMGQTWINLKTNQSRWAYVDYITSLSSIYPKGSRVLLLGLAGGKLADQLQRSLQHDVTAVDLDPRMEMIAKDYFNMSREIEIVIDDGRHYLKTTEEMFDVIIFDVFSGDVPPNHLLSFEAFQDARQKLKQGGMLLVNFNGFKTGRPSQSGRSIFKTIVATGLEVKGVSTYGGTEKSKNNIFIAADKIPDFSQPALLLNIRGKPINFNDSLFIFNDEDLVQAYELHDNNPQLDVLNYEASIQWREDYKKRIKFSKQSN